MSQRKFGQRFNRLPEHCVCEGLRKESSEENYGKKKKADS